MREIKLPSGKTITVVTCEDVARPDPEIVVEPTEGIHVCKECDGHFVYPLDWEEHDDDHWWVLLRCPECCNVSEGIYHQVPLDEFDSVLDRGFESLNQDLGSLTRANMADWADGFFGALQADAILPFDF